MSDIKNIWLIAGTSSSSSSAGSSNALDLEFNLSDGSDVNLGTSSSDRTDKWGSKSDPGDAATWYWMGPFDDGSGNEVTFEVSQILSIDLEITSDDAWLPANIFVVLQDSDGNYTMISANGAWPSDDWFSTDTSDAGGTAKAEYVLYSSS